LNELQIFKNEAFGEIRTVEINNKAYFMASDIAKALGYLKPNDAISKHCRATTKWSTPISGKMQEVNFIPEGDIYRLITKSQLPSAEKFEAWVFDEVLPTIRKHGMYATDELLDNPDLLIQVATALKAEREKNKQLETEVKVKNQLIGELKPKADYVDRILQNSGLVTITQIAKDYGMSGQAMNELLHELKVQYKQSEQWLLYSKYHDQGYTHSKTVDIKHKDGTPDVKMNTKWTQKGRLFLYELLKCNGHLPTIEQLKSA
jgi:prophage antirepressor-like protein